MKCHDPGLHYIFMVPISECLCGIIIDNKFMAPSSRSQDPLLPCLQPQALRLKPPGLTVPGPLVLDPPRFF